MTDIRIKNFDDCEFSAGNGNENRNFEYTGFLLA